MLKNLGLGSRTFLVNVFNRCLESGYCPAAWKRSKVVPIAKPGKDPTSPSSYRPISLLSTISKLFERVNYTRLLYHTELNNILPDLDLDSGGVTQLSTNTNSIRPFQRQPSWHSLTWNIRQCVARRSGAQVVPVEQPGIPVRIISDNLDGWSSQVCIGSSRADPLPTYGSPVWHSCAKTHRNKPKKDL